MFRSTLWSTMLGCWDASTNSPPYTVLTARMTLPVTLEFRLSQSSQMPPPAMRAT